MQLTPYQLKTANSFMESTPVICHDPKGDFMATLKSYGFTPPDKIRMGEIDRIDGPNDKPHQGSGWYVYHEIDDTTEDGYVIGVASFGDWKGDDAPVKWSSRTSSQMNDREQRNYREKVEVMRAQQIEEQRNKHQEAAAKAYNIWSKLSDATNDHPYLKEKGVIACDGVKVTPQNDLIIPAAIENQLTTLQSIKAWGEYEVNGRKIGNKRFQAGGKSKGAYFVINGDSSVIYIAEGYSTGMSVRMATGNTVYVCFNCHNIYDVTAFAKVQHKDAQIIIAGDDDFNNEINAGRKYAETAARAHDVIAIFPEGVNDFNDAHVKYGLDAVKKLLKPSKKSKTKIEDEAKAELTPPTGALGHIFDYYNATSGIEQYGFSIQTALAICATILGRKFRTNMHNFPSLYFINVGKSGTGKEHAKTTLEKVLDATGFSHLVCGDGFTSAGAVYSILLGSPVATTCIDEFGRYLEASAAGGKGANANQREANTKLMEAFGRTHSVLRPPNYSTMTLTKEAQKDMKSRFIHNPALTVLGMTTPSTLFKTLTMDAIKDGFVNRFVISISNVERAIRYFGQEIDVPTPICEWAEKIKQRTEEIHVASEPAKPTVLTFTDKAINRMYEFQQYTNVDLPNSLDRYGMPEISGRSNEIAMKIALICALSRDPMAEEINEEDMKWSINYVKHCLEQTIDALKMTISSSDFESHKKEVLFELRKREDGITWSQMQRTPPFSQHNPKYLKEIMGALRDADLADFEAHNPKGRGRPTSRWFAT